MKGPRPSPLGSPPARSPPNTPEISPARSFQLQPHAPCPARSGGDLRPPGAGSRGGPSQGPPPVDPFPPPTGPPRSGAGEWGGVRVSLSLRHRPRSWRRRSGRYLGPSWGWWRGVLGTGLRGRHFPGFLIAGGTAPQGAPGRARESAPNCGAGAQPPGLERSRTRASSEPFLSPAFPNLPSRARDPLGSL